MRAETLRQDACLRCQRLILKMGSQEQLGTRLEVYGITRTWLRKILNQSIDSPGTKQLDKLLDALDRVEKT